MQQKLEAQDAILERLHEAMQQAQAQPLPAPQALVPPVPQVIHQVVHVLHNRNNEANLYERFRRARALEFEGSYDPLVADE